MEQTQRGALKPIWRVIRVKEECIPRKSFLITRSIGRQIGLHEEIKFPAPEDNKRRPEKLEGTLKKALELQKVIHEMSCDVPAVL